MEGRKRFDLDSDYPKNFDDQNARDILADDIRLRSLCQLSPESF